MVLIGLVGAIVTVGVLAVNLGEFRHKSELALVIVLFFVSIAVCVYDGTSPVDVSVERTIVTNDYEKYYLDIDVDTLGIVEERKFTPTRPLAILDRTTDYYFIGFVE